MVSATSSMSPMMNDDTEKKASGRSGAKQDRLASALRENLKRRKTQARQRAATTEAAPDDASAPHEGTAGKTRG